MINNYTEKNNVVNNAFNTTEGSLCKDVPKKIIEHTVSENPTKILYKIEWEIRYDNSKPLESLLHLL